MSDKVPVGTRVRYHGSAGPHGEYIIQGHNDPAGRADLPPEAIAEGYPDGISYELWPPGVPVKFGNRDQAIYFVRRASFDVIDAGDPGWCTCALDKALIVHSCDLYRGQPLRISGKEVAGDE